MIASKPVANERINNNAQWKRTETMTRKIAQNAARVENMMIRYQRQVGSVTARHTIHDISFRAKLGTGPTVEAVSFLHDIGAVSAEIYRGTIMYSIKGVVK